MTNLLQQFEEKQVSKLTESKNIPDFQAGDTIRVNAWIIEGKNKRIQAFEGLCIARKNRGVNSSFTVRKLSHGEGVERIFSTYSPLVDSIEVIRRGVVRRAKLYYMRELTGKAARIKEKRELVKKDDKKTAKPAKKEEAKAAETKEAPKEAPKQETTEEKA